MREISLLLLALIFSVAAPIYNKIRSGMKAESKAPVSSFNKTRVIKLTFINFFLMLAVELFMFMHYESIFRISTNADLNILFTILFIIVISISFFGSGIYITAIVADSFTLPRLKKIKEYQIQDIAEHLYHGMLSHALIYCGWTFNFLILSLYELIQTSPTTNWGLLLFAGGAFLGISFAVTQIQIDTYLYPFIAGIASLIILLFFLAVTGKIIFGYILPSFFLGFLISLVSVNIGYFGFLRLKNMPIHFDRVKY